MRTVQRGKRGLTREEGSVDGKEKEEKEECWSIKEERGEERKEMEGEDRKGKELKGGRAVPQNLSDPVAAMGSWCVCVCVYAALCSTCR